MKLRKRAEGPEGLHGLEDTEMEKQGCAVKKRKGEGSRDGGEVWDLSCNREQECVVQPSALWCH